MWYPLSGSFSNKKENAPSGNGAFVSVGVWNALRITAPLLYPRFKMRRRFFMFSCVFLS